MVFLHRPYRAPSFTQLSILGLTPQAISHHPFGVLDPLPTRPSIHFHFLPEHLSLRSWRDASSQMCKGCHGNEHLSAPIPDDRDSTMARKHEVRGRTQCAPTLTLLASLRRSDRAWLRAPRPGSVFFVSWCLCGECLLCVSVVIFFW